ncbi:protein cramped-like isoform X2 [Chrysoperla carnea]|uniref:protein cramped-like isoform X2 n=1 Tax=Chrysoperla carnea TaxID=189513 RepID=UPI001D06D2F8|nr:protein cramped-like isoform X2 [Chrysoperla carnea]
METSNTAVTNEITKEQSLRALALSLPIEEMLGSVTTYNIDGYDQSSGKGHQQLRTSARVIKKLKLDSTPTSEKDKKFKLDSGYSCDKDGHSSKEDDRTSEVKQKIIRPKVVWSPEDKSHFFEAIKEYGKDFAGIHDYILAKYKKLGVGESQIKTKDQIRHFYYRTWHKISKYLKFSDEVKKVVQEYYALINYGELRRKIGISSEKTCVKLNELIYRGSTQIRIKGKTIRIKTPMCRALRRINQIDDGAGEFKLPAQVVVELKPRDMESWMYVQSMSQNPRVHCTIPLQKRLNALLSCLDSRWRTHEQINLEKTINGQQTTSPDGVATNGDDKKFLLDPILRVAPKLGASIQIPTVNYSELINTHQVSLNAYEERMGIKNRGEPIWLASINSLKAMERSLPLKKGTKRARNDSVGDKTTEKPPIKKENIEELSGKTKIVDSDVNTILALSHGNVDEKKEVETATTCSNENQKQQVPNNVKIEVEESVTKIEHLKTIENVRNGWTVNDTDSITIGELYLMMGNNSKIELEYWWEIPQIKQENGEVVDTKCTQLTTALQKLLSLAKLYYRKEKIECPCGHVCGATNNNRSMNVSRNKTVPAYNKNMHKIETRPNLPETTTMEEISLTSKNTVSQGEDGIFRLPVPFNAAARQNSALEAFKAKLDSLKPKFCYRRGRTFRNKQVVVQRTLPLLPKSGANDTSILQMKVIPKFQSMHQKIEPTYVQSKPTQHSIALSPIRIESVDDGSIPDEGCSSTESTDDNVKDGMVSDNNSSQNITDGFLSENVRGIETPLSASPSRLLKEDDAHWLNSEVADFSLSSFLGHLESPIKTTVPNNDDSRMSQDMEVQLQSLMNENSIDYMAKFADLAAQMASDNQKK